MLHQNSHVASLKAELFPLKRFIKDVDELIISPYTTEIEFRQKLIQLLKKIEEQAK